MLAPFNALWADESGQDLVEYALLVALIAIVVIAALRIIQQHQLEPEHRLIVVGGRAVAVRPPPKNRTQTGDHPWISAHSDWS
jgi:Flp pilus assembly pilin Flp